MIPRKLGSRRTSLTPCMPVTATYFPREPLEIHSWICAITSRISMASTRIPTTLYQGRFGVASIPLSWWYGAHRLVYRMREMLWFYRVGRRYDERDISVTFDS